jgi:ribosomal protein S18 acetylase RimI-like enzyme
MLVDEEHRARGIGEALLVTGLDWTRRQGLSDVSLLVFPHNERAIALYRKYGFETRDYYPDDVTRQTGEVWDTMLMTKRLD